MQLSHEMIAYPFQPKSPMVTVSVLLILGMILV